MKAQEKQIETGGIFFKKFTCFAAVAEDSLNGGTGQQVCNIGRIHVADAAIRRTDDFTALDNIPYGDVVF